MKSLIALITLFAFAPLPGKAQPTEHGKFLHAGAPAAIPLPADTNPMFDHWLVGLGRPLGAQFSAKPDTAYRVFIGLTEAYWNKPGQRLMDLEVAGKIVATVDSFQQAKGTPSGYVFPARTDAQGRLVVRVCPHPGAPDTNTVVCGVLLFPADGALDVAAIIRNRAPQPLVTLAARDAGALDADPDVALHGRVDNELVAGYGTCQVDDFRFFTMLHQQAWDFLQWETLGNAVMEHRTWRNWPYEQRLMVTADGDTVSTDAGDDPLRVEQIEQQFDFRNVTLASKSLRIERLDMMQSARSWVTAIRLTNLKTTPATLVVGAEWTTKHRQPLDVSAWSDGNCKGFSYASPNGPPILVALEPVGAWDAIGNAAVRSRWTLELKPGETRALYLDAFIGWTALPAYRDSGPGLCASREQVTTDRRADRDGFRRVMAALGVADIGQEWPQLVRTCAAKRDYLYAKMPQLTGFDPAWEGMWSYGFDLMRSGIYPAQGKFEDVWMVASYDVYREPFYWDTGSTMHTFCNWDAGLSARMLQTFWSSMLPDGTVCVSANPYRAFPNPTPQLANELMSLWECYRITRDKEILARFYPGVVKHVRWLETRRNRTPNGPLMDIGYNIDYGPPQLYQTPTLWPDVQFFLVDRYRHLAKIAALLGKPQAEIDEWAGRADRLAEGIRKHMWDEAEGSFWCVSDKLEFKKIPSPIEFHGMVANIPTREQAKRLLTRLQDPAKYAPTPKHPYGLPSAPFDSPLFVVKDSWSGTIWPIQTYYTVRGLINYGYQDEAAALSTNLYGMMARDYWKTGSIWEQYDPVTGNDLSSMYKTANQESGRGYFTSGITTSVFDMLLRGVIGFERTDDPLAFNLTPRPMKKDWHGIKGLTLSGTVKLDIEIKDAGDMVACRVTVAGLKARHAGLQILENDKPCRQLHFNDRNEVEVTIPKNNGSRYLWRITESFTMNTSSMQLE